MSIPTTRQPGDLARIDYAVDLSHNNGIHDAWERVKADIATRELAVAERDKAREAFRGLEVEYDAALARAEACCEATERATVKLREATKAGTAYWHERDTMNALVIENHRFAERTQTAERERDKVMEAFRGIEVEYDAALARAEAEKAWAEKLDADFAAALARAEAAESQNIALIAAVEAIPNAAPPPDRGVLAARIVDGVKPSPEIDGHNPTEDQWRVIYRYRELVGQGVDFTTAATRARVEFVERVLVEAGGGC